MKPHAGETAHDEQDSRQLPAAQSADGSVAGEASPAAADVTPEAAWTTRPTVLVGLREPDKLIEKLLQRFTNDYGRLARQAAQFEVEAAHYERQVQIQACMRR
jgi:hypothetical protein